MAGPLIGNSVAFREVTEAIAMVAPVDSAVLLLGETGTGKEVIARAIHDAGPRRHQRFVAVNCAAIPVGLLESELFGHERGAFTGAVSQTVGRFQAADRGTLFLDEVGDLPLELQPKLLRALQEQQVERLGSGGRATSVDVRVIAATNQDLEEMVQQRAFRADLFYRLNVFPIRVPPLRERAEDIPLLIAHFVRRFAERQGKKVEEVPDEVIATLKHYSWPGNVRELQNVIERAVVATTGPHVATAGAGAPHRPCGRVVAHARASRAGPHRGDLAGNELGARRLGRGGSEAGAIQNDAYLQDAAPRHRGPRQRRHRACIVITGCHETRARRAGRRCSVRLQQVLRRSSTSIISKSVARSQKPPSVHVATGVSGGRSVPR